MTDRKSNADVVLTDLWLWLHDQKKVDLVPWNNNPLENAWMKGYHAAFKDVEDFICRASAEAKNP